MKRVNTVNPNSPEHWDNVYETERGSGKRRIDSERLAFVIDGIRHWLDHNPYNTNKNFLDVGCGDGEMLRHVHADIPDWKMFGLDIAPKTIAWASTVDPTFNYQVASALGIPHNPGQFQIIFCGETLEHLENPEAAVDEMFRVLAPGGYLICSLPCNHNNYSDEHLNEFTVMDAVKMTTKGDMLKLVDLDVKCGGLSTIWITKKDNDQ